MSELFAREGVGTIIAIATAASVAVLLGAVGLLVVDRLSLRGKLRQIDDLYKLVDVRDQELMLPFVDRVAAPVLSGLTQVGQRFSPAGRVEQMRVMLRRAGRPEVDTDRYLAISVLSILESPLVGVVVWPLDASQAAMQRGEINGPAVGGGEVLPSRTRRTGVGDRGRESLSRP